LTTATERPTRKAITLRNAGIEFWKHPSPWVIGTILVSALTARMAAGDWRLSDALVPVVMLALFPFFEWVVHVFVLHWRPKTIGGLTIDPVLAREHRRHHGDPRDIPTIFIPWKALLWAAPLAVGTALLAFPQLHLGLTFLVVLMILGLGYEWTHYLIHSDHRPRTRVYRAVWRNHRLHHYRNEHYWFTVTTAGTADRLFGTYPDPETVSTSATAKNLHGAG
jgi:hypothetical protein